MSRMEEVSHERFLGLADLIGRNGLGGDCDRDRIAFLKEIGMDHRFVTLSGHSSNFGMAVAREARKHPSKFEELETNVRRALEARQSGLPPVPPD